MAETAIPMEAHQEEEKRTAKNNMKKNTATIGTRELNAEDVHVEGFSLAHQDGSSYKTRRYHSLNC